MGATRARPAYRRAAIAVGLLVASAIVVLGVAQLVLPGIAAQQLRDRLSRSGRVLTVKVDAFPAIELLWHQADRVVIRMASYHATPGHLGSTLADAVDAGSLYASTQRLQTGLLTLRHATLTKRGDQLVGSATVSQSDLRSAVPFIQGLEPVASGNGKLTLQGTAFGVTADATLMAVNGKLVVQPNVPILNFFTVKVFSNPHLAVEAVAARGVPGGFVFTGRGRLR